MVISFDNFKLQDDGPIYQQILLYIKRGIVAGTIKNWDELPSRRVLSALLGVNPNTVQKACKMLEEEGLIESMAGSKSVMSLTSEKVETIRAELLEADAKGAVMKLRMMGLSKEEAKGLLDKYWESEDSI